MLWEEGHTPCEDELHCMMGRTEGAHNQVTVRKATWCYAEGEQDCLGLGCDMDNWCWGLAEDDQATSETQI